MFSLMAYLSGTVGGSGTIPTVTDNLKSEGKIEKESIGISYVPTDRHRSGQWRVDLRF